MTTAVAAPVLQSKAEITRGRVIGIAMLLLAGLAAWAFGAGSDGDATFVVTRDLAENIGIDVPASGMGFLVAAVLAFFGGYQLSRGFGDRVNLVLAIGLGLFVIAFLAWAAAGQSFNLAGMLQESAKRAVPILFGALSGVFSERVAVINIGIEGMLLGGAFSGALFGSLWGATAGILAATLTGGLLALVRGVLSIKYRVDQIIAGVVINIFVLGLTNFLTAQILVENPEYNAAPILSPIRIPLLADIPVIGSMFFDQNLFVYAALITVAAATFGLFRTRWGLRARAVGEHPKAADTLGVHVLRVRYL